MIPKSMILTSEAISNNLYHAPIEQLWFLSTLTIIVSYNIMLDNKTSDQKEHAR